MRSFNLAAIIVFVLTVFSVGAHANVPSELSFTVLRNGYAIGTHDYKFQNDGQRTVVEIVTDIKVKVAFITAYRFEHTTKEEWAGGKLISASSVSNDDGEKHKLKIAHDGNVLNIEGNGKKSQVELGSMPASLWHPDTVKSTDLMSTLDGHIMTVKVEDLGVEPVKVIDSEINAHHYRLSGDLERELWFDPKGTLVQVRFEGSDGSKIEYVLR